VLFRSTIISAVEWVIADHQDWQPAVANFSLGGGAYSVFDVAINALIADGVTVVVSAMNDSADACTVSPARVPAAITVAASDISDTAATFTNYGSCVDLYAPGVDVLSAGISSTSATALMSGTSMAAPHVSGAVAMMLQASPTLTPSQVSARLVSDATTGAIYWNPSGTPNRLLYTGACAAPVNDNFAAATPLARGNSTVYTFNTCATGEFLEPLHAGRSGGRSLWWTFTAPSAGTLTLSTLGSGFDTLLGVYTGANVWSLTSVAASDDYSGLTSQVSFAASAGVTYRIAVDGFVATTGGVTLTATWSGGCVPPSNDAFAAASALPLASTSVNVSTTCATKEAGEPNHAGSAGGHSAWWTFTAPKAGLLTLSTFGSGFDTTLAVYTGSSVAALTSVVSNDDFSGSTRSAWRPRCARAATCHCWWAAPCCT
jgi:hypothetical protein